MYYAIKVLSSAVLILIISEIAKKSTFWGAIFASLPFVSIIALIFLYQESKDLERISDLSMNIFWLVIPSLALFITLPIFLKKGLNFYLSMGLASVITILFYFILTQVLQYFGIMKIE